MGEAAKMSDRLNRTGNLGSRTGIMPRIQDMGERRKEAPTPPLPPTLPEFVDEDGVTGAITTTTRNEGEDAAKQADDDPTASAAS